MKSITAAFARHTMNYSYLHCIVLVLLNRWNWSSVFVWFILLCDLAVFSQQCNVTITQNTLQGLQGNTFRPFTSPLSIDWPCDWNNGRIPFVFNFYIKSTKRLLSLVKKGHDYIEKRSCLIFEEYDPAVVAKKENFTYLFYTYSGALEECCLRFYTKAVGRRLVLITPNCSVPGEVAHATLHGMGLRHSSSAKYGFDVDRMMRVLFPRECPHMQEKFQNLNLKVNAKSHQRTKNIDLLSDIALW